MRSSGGEVMEKGVLIVVAVVFALGLYVLIKSMSGDD